MPGIGFKGSRVLRNRPQETVQVETITYPVSGYRVRKQSIVRTNGPTGGPLRETVNYVLEQVDGGPRFSIDDHLNNHLKAAVLAEAVAIDVIIQVRFPAGAGPIEHEPQRTVRRIQPRKET